MITLEQHKTYLSKAIKESGVVGTKVVESLSYQQALDAVKAWTLPAVAVLYGGCQRTAPQEESRRPTHSVDMDFDILLITATKDSLGNIKAEPLNELQRIRKVVQSIALPSKKPYVFMLERVLKSDDKITQWLLSFRVAETI